jgi:sterol desaturase/sphingolipid hydroxylase (fatty acid hydroxylase superfamily)
VDSKLVALAVPFFFGFIAFERWATRRAPDRTYRLWDSITNLSCGVGQQVLALVFDALLVGAFTLVSERFALCRLTGPAALAVALVGVDFAYYWFHRTSHRVRFVWAAHVVHHQSEEYNLSVALRQSWIQPLLSLPFYMPLAVVGVPTSAFVLALTADVLYQFWIHTRAVRRLGPLEWIFNTPSHHRVHHGIDPEYVDKNYAGILIVWDRLFGTFAAEKQEPTYGTVKPLASFNAMWANVEPWLEIGGLVRASETLGEKLRAPFAPPEWRPRALGGVATVPSCSRETQKRYAVRVPRGVAAYVLTSFALAVAATLVLMLHKATMSPPGLATAIVLVLWALTTLGGLVEARAWAVPVELARLVALPAALWALSGPCGAAVGGAVTVASTLFLLAARPAPRAA